MKINLENFRFKTFKRLQAKQSEQYKKWSIFLNGYIYVFSSFFWGGDGMSMILCQPSSKYTESGPHELVIFDNHIKSML